MGSRSARRRCWRWVILPLFVSALFLPSQASSRESSAVSTRGISYGVISDPSRTASVADLGFTWVKYLVYWDYAQPQRGGAVKFDPYDAWVDTARSKGLHVLMRVDQSPSWATGTTSKNAPPINDSDLADFMAQMAAHFKGRVDAWELWNEPNLNYEWGYTRPDPAKYARMLQAVYPKLKAADPQTLLIASGLSTAGGDFDDTGNDEHIGDLGYLKLLAQAGAQGYFDALGSHPYGGPYPPEQDYDINNSTTPVGLYFRRAELQHEAWLWASGQDVPIWATEFGWIQDFGWNCTWADAGVPWGRQAQKVTPQQQADYLVRAFQYAQSHWPWMGPMIFYNLDRAVGTPQGCNNDYDRFYGIMKPDGSPTAAYTQLKAMAKADNAPPISRVDSLPSYSPASFTVRWGGNDNPGGAGIQSYYVQKREGGGPWAYWLSGTSNTSATVTGSHGQRLSFRVQAVDRSNNWELFRSDDGDASTTVDALPPDTAVLQYSTPVTSTAYFPVRWAGSDDGSGIASYDVQYRDGAGGSWIDLTAGSTLTQMYFFQGQDRHTYYLRSRARDRAGNVEDYPPAPDSQILVSTTPYITTTISSLALVGQRGWSSTMPRISFSNLGAYSTSWQAATTASWLSVSPASGILAPGGTASLGVTAAIPVTGTGTTRFDASVVITATSAWNSPLSIGATLFAVESVHRTHLPLLSK